MGKTSATITNKWHKEHYDIIHATIPKGYADVLREIAQKQGKSVNSLINEKLVEKFEKKEDA